jgi:hypothetical protein
MQDVPFTILDEGRATTVPATVVPGRVTLAPDAVESALGWKLEPEGLCRDGVCVPVRGHEADIHSGGIDLAALAERLDRPVAIDTERAAAALGTSAGERRRQLESKLAPDFSLPDLAGQTHSLSDFRGKKVLLVAYASW